MSHFDRLLNLSYIAIPVLLTSAIIAVLANYGHATSVTPLLIASIGASITIIFVIPSSPMGKTWPLVGGHLTAALVGIGLTAAFDDLIVLITLTITCTIIIMIVLKCVHPPGVATALVPVLSHTSQPDVYFILDPVLLNVLPLALSGIVYRRWNAIRSSKTTQKPSINSKSAHEKSSLYFDELHKVLETRNEWLDIDEQTLDEIFKQTHLLALEHKSPKLTCKHVMTENILALTESDSVYEGLNTLQNNKFSAIPIINSDQEIVGIFSLVDFLLYVEKRKINSFVGLYLLAKKKTSKTIGQYMKRNPITMHEEQHVARLIPYLTSGFHHIPIVNSKSQLVGMVTQSDLIEFLYNLKK
ncbi:HPP family protein [Vibrio parahaemolyticus]|uniref:HPP family protein n=2 Tax=Vibrio harveyi group TaxID=717610 RepID=UPI002B215853|nr:HPP family protein [Vibrio parahaemolyticus]MEA5368375.1 HPP family protein [Vibrio parahaemolyticus]